MTMIRTIRVVPLIEGAIDWVAVHPEDAKKIVPASVALTEAVLALRGKHPGIPEWVEDYVDFWEYVEDILDVHPRLRDAGWEARKAAALDANKALKAWVEARYEKPEIEVTGTVTDTDWPPLVANPLVRRQPTP